LRPARGQFVSDERVHANEVNWNSVDDSSDFGVPRFIELDSAADFVQDIDAVGGSAWNPTAYPPTTMKRTSCAANPDNSSLKSELIFIPPLHRGPVEGRLPDRFEPLLGRKLLPVLEIKVPLVFTKTR
jgi:hypothetical protein